jgi:hypothetical protein
MELNMRIRVLALPAAFILAVPLMASSIYTYTGNDFTSATAPLTTSDSVTGSFTVASPLADNLEGVNIEPSSTAFSFSDGHGDTLTNTTPGIGVSPFSLNITISTNGSGNIINWDVELIAGPTGGFTILTDNFFSVEDIVSDDNSVDASNSGDAGHWSGSTTSAAPEPGSLGLLGAGLLALTGAIRWKSRRP